MNVTRNVISDLWPVYAAGEASEDTRKLVEAFLAQDRDFARTLRPAATLPHADLQAPAGGEVEALRRTRDLVHGRSWLRGLRLLALVLTVLAISRVVGEISSTDAARFALLEGFAAIACWAAYLLLLRRYRARALKTTLRT